LLKVFFASPGKWAWKVKAAGVIRFGAMRACATRRNVRGQYHLLRERFDCLSNADKEWILRRTATEVLA
jgi:ribosomal protein L37AE/L43A